MYATERVHKVLKLMFFQNNRHHSGRYGPTESFGRNEATIFETYILERARSSLCQREDFTYRQEEPAAIGNEQ